MELGLILVSKWECEVGSSSGLCVWIDSGRLPSLGPVQGKNPTLHRRGKVAEAERRKEGSASIANHIAADR